MGCFCPRSLQPTDLHLLVLCSFKHLLKLSQAFDPIVMYWLQYTRKLFDLCKTDQFALFAQLIWGKHINNKHRGVFRHLVIDCQEMTQIHWNLRHTYYFIFQLANFVHSISCVLLLFHFYKKIYHALWQIYNRNLIHFSLNMSINCASLTVIPFQKNDVIILVHK